MFLVISAVFMRGGVMPSKIKALPLCDFEFLVSSLAEFFDVFKAVSDHGYPSPQ